VPFDSIAWVTLMHRGVCIAGKPAPTEKQNPGGIAANQIVEA